jgi:periplasmic divalent cation tolerance protein
MFKPGILLVTAPNEKVATELAEVLVTERLAACTSIHPVTSTYRWDGKVNVEKEFQLVIKTNLEHFELIKNRIKTFHPYDVPEIIATPITHGLDSYLNWIRESTL